jgi:hypothetical protein
LFEVWIYISYDYDMHMTFLVQIITYIGTYSRLAGAPKTNVSANYRKPGLPATTYLVPNANYMNNIFKPVID